MIGQRQAFRDAEAERVALGGGEPPPSPEDYMGGPMPFNEPVQAQIPSFKALDYVKKGVDRVINEKYRNPNTGKVDLRIPGAREEVALAKQFRDELVALNPSYKAALDTAGEYLQAETAFKFGQDAVFKTGVDARSFVKRLSDMTDGERQAVKAGVANRAYEAMLNGRLKPQMFNTPAVRMKLEAVFGRDGTQKFLSAMNSEAKMAAFERRYAPGAGSITSDMAAAMAEQDGGNPLAMQAIDLAGQAVTQGSRAAVMNAVVNGAKGAAARWATRGMSVPVRDAAGNMLAGDPNQLAAILRAREAVPPQSPLNSLAVRYQIPGQSNPLNARAQRAPNPR